MRRMFGNLALSTAVATGLGGCAGESPRDFGEVEQAVTQTSTGAVTATLETTSSWSGGYCDSVTLKNTGSQVTQWTLKLASNGSTISSIWSANQTTSGATITVTPASYNASIPSGGSISFGFCGSGSAQPTLTSLTVIGGSGGGSGGASSVGGATSRGGTTATGGSKAMGGTTATGGSKAMGGTTAAGGSKAMGGTTAAGGSSSKPKFHVFLLLGQSNMAGYPKAQSADKIQNSRISVLGYDNCSATARTTDKWAVAVPPLHECWNGAIGPGDWFSKSIVSSIAASDTIGLVPCAISGEKIETFMKIGGSKYSWIVNRAKLAQQAGGIIDGILFHQGESNCGDSTWPSKVATLVANLRADLGIGNVPFLAGELAPTGACSQHNTQVAKLPSLINNAYVVSASGLTLDASDTTWRLHFDHDSQVTLGKRYAQTMVSALKW